MCLNPLTIRNPKKDFNKFNDKPFLVVPCGKCVECIEQKKLSFEVRTFYEYLWHIDKGGMVFFYTLTYNNKFLPHFEIQKKFSSVSNRFNCFDRNHIKRFVERIRNLHDDLVFLITSEFGGTTRRPHYHCLFFLPYKVNPYDFYDYISSCWQYGGKSLGNVYCGADLGVLNSPSACKYVTKYVCKDDVFDDVLKRFNKCYFESIYYNKFAIDDLKWFNDHKKLITPLVYKSMSFGKHALEYVKNISQSLGTINIPYKNIDVPLPMYYFRKLYYNVEKDENNNNKYVLNENGIQHKIFKFNSLVRSKVNKINSLKVLKKVPFELQKVLFHYTALNFDYFTQIYDFISLKNIRDLVIYDYVYKDRLCTECVTFVPKDDMKLFFTPFVVPFPDYRFVDDRDFLTFNRLMRFDGFDLRLLVVRICQTFFKYELYVERIKRKNSLARLKMSQTGNDFGQLCKIKKLNEFSKLFDYAE